MKLFKKCEGASTRSPLPFFVTSRNANSWRGKRTLRYDIKRRLRPTLAPSFPSWIAEGVFSWFDRIFHTDRNLIVVFALFCLLFTSFLSVCLLIFLVLLKVALGPMHSGYHACLTRRSTAGSLLSRSFKIPLSSNIAVCQRSQKKRLGFSWRCKPWIHYTDLT